MQFSGYEDKISIIIPAYNRERLIQDCLDSIVHQTYRYWEALVVDDGSTDNTKGIVKKYSSTDPRIKLIERKRDPKGGATCRNIGAASANGDYLIFLDSDDVLSPECLENRIKIISQYPDLDFVAFPTRLFKQTIGDTQLYWNKPVKEESDLKRFFYFDMPWHTTGPIWKKSSFHRLGGFNERALSMQDWELHVRAIISKFNYKVIDDLSLADVHYRRHDFGSISGDWQHKDVLFNKIELFDLLLIEIDNNLELTPELKKAYANLYFWISFDILKIYGIKPALKAFSSIVKYQLLSVTEYHFWRFYLMVALESRLNGRIRERAKRLMMYIASKMGDTSFIHRSGGGTFLNYHWVNNSAA